MHNLPGLQPEVILSLRGQIQKAIHSPPGRVVVIPGQQIPEAPGAVTPGHPARVAADLRQEHALILLRHAQAAVDQERVHPAAADPEERDRTDQSPMSPGTNTIIGSTISSNDPNWYHPLAGLFVVRPRDITK